MNNRILYLAFACAALLAPDIAHALSGPVVGPPPPAYTPSYDTNIGNVLCTAYKWMVGNTGKGLAVIAVSITGIGALLGKVSWGNVLLVGIGIALLFGAPQILSAMRAGKNGTMINSLCNDGTTFML